MVKKLFKKEHFYILCSIFVLVLFAYITYQTPLCGDDWGYALNGSLGTPIKTALAFYQSWSGRFFSELWGMIVPCHKWIWNIVNPLLFCGIFVCIYKLAHINKKYITAPLLIIAIMLSVDDNLRMETYTLIMGTTYIIPLFLSLLYFLVIDTMMRNDLYDTKFKVFAYLDNICLFIIGLMMENIAATMIVGEVVLIIYAYFNKKKALKYLIINLIVSVVSFTIMRMSPGSSARLLSEHPTWTNMSLFEKITSAYPNFLQITFINNNYAIALFSIVLILFIVYSKKEVSLVYKICSILILMLGIFTVFSFVLGDTVFNDSTSLYSLLFWPLYIINAFMTIFLFTNNDFLTHKALFLLMIAGCNALVMLYSPIYGSRCAVYTVYYLIVVSAMLFNETIVTRKTLMFIFLILFLAIIGDRTHEYANKYHWVGLRQKERLIVIQYYKDHPDVEEAWIPRFPVNSIHGGDVEEGDTYHFETFKEYYDLPQSADKIIFYFWES